MFVRINIVPNGNSCMFDPRRVPDVRTMVGGSAYWTFCSTCSLDTKVELATDTPGPFDSFAMFIPFPTADNLVTVDLPHNSERDASGSQAKTDGLWKYDLTLQPASPGLPLDQIDPRLEIDPPARKLEIAPPALWRLQWFLRFVLVLVGGALGAFGMWLNTRRGRQ